MLKRPTILLWVCLSVGLSFDDPPYCSVRYRRLCQGKGRHVACQFPDYGSGPACENYTQIKFTTHLKHFITSYINRRRQRIASGNERVRGGIHVPQPQVMMLVEWDRELAFLAQRLADQCYFVHDDCRATVRYPYAGQTVGEVRWRRSSDSDELSAQRAITRVFDAWWGERRRVYPKQLTSPFRFTKGAVWGHFSQLAVWSLTAAGCGAVRHGRSHARLLLVCDFSHTNMLGQRTLSPGPLAPCPIHTMRKPRSAYPLLCAPVRYLKPEEGDYHSDFEDDLEGDPDDTVEVDEVPAPTTWLGDNERPEHRRKYPAEAFVDPESEDDNQFRPVTKETTMRRPKTKRMEEETHPRVEATEPSDRSEVRESDGEAHRAWRPAYEQWRERQESVAEAASQKYYEGLGSGNRNPQYYRRTMSTTEAGVRTQDTIIRQKWRQQRYRPRRPGANALLYMPAVKQAARTSIVSLNLDKEDLDQLFIDTGFNIGGKKRISSTP